MLSNTSMFLLWQSDDPAVYLNNQCIPGALFIYIYTFFITSLFKVLIEIVIVIVF